MLISLAVIFVLLVLSGFFSGSETALTAASKPLMHEMEKRGHRRAALVNRLMSNRERLIGAILLGNNLVNIMASALATGVLIGLFGDAGVVYATVTMTLLVLIFSEIMPKTFAIRHANKVALAVAPVMRPLVFVLAPLIQSIHWVVRLTLVLFGANRPSEQSRALRQAELRGVIDMHRGQGVKDERAMLKSVLDLGDLEVGEIMIHRKSLSSIDCALPPQDIVEQVLSSPYTRLPLWKNRPDNIIGVLHAKELFRAVRRLPEDLAGLNVRSVAVKAWFVPENTSALNQLQAFRDRREHFALVVDEYGVLQGAVTLEDILEEIVGDIADEHDVAVTGVTAEPDGSYVVKGGVTIRDLNRQMEWRLPDEEAATIAGLVLTESRMIPETGQVFLVHGFRMEILERRRNQIVKLRVTPPTPKDFN